MKIQKNSRLYFLVKKYGGNNDFDRILNEFGKNIKLDLIEIIFSLHQISKYRRYILLHKRYTKNSFKRIIILYGKEKGQIEFEKYRNLQKIKSKRCLEYWLSLGLSKKDAKLKLKEYQNKASLNSFIERHGKKKGKKEFEKYIQLKTESFKKTWKENTEEIIKKTRDSWNKKTPSEILKIRKKQAATLENFINRYGKKKGSIKFKEYCTRRKNNSNTKIQHYLNKGFNEEEAIKKLSERQRTFSLESCIIKYGEERGRDVWKQRQIKWQKTFTKNNDMRQVNKKRKINASAGYYSEKIFNKNPQLKNENGYFYVMDFFNDGLIKIGMTKNNPKRRFGKRNVDYKIIECYSGNLYEVFLLEKYLLKKFSKYVIKDNKISSKECFEKELYVEINKEIKNEIGKKSFNIQRTFSII
jgi:uncharacterized protein YaeQ